MYPCLAQLQKNITVSVRLAPHWCLHSCTRPPPPVLAEEKKKKKRINNCTFRFMLEFGALVFFFLFFLLAENFEALLVIVNLHRGLIFLYCCYRYSTV